MHSYWSITSSSNSLHIFLNNILPISHASIGTSVPWYSLVFTLILYHVLFREWNRLKKEYKESNLEEQNFEEQA